MAFAVRSGSARLSMRQGSAFKAAQPVRRTMLAPVRASAVSEIVEKLKTLTLLEASELVAEIEKTFGVDASAAVAAPQVAAPAAAAAAPVVEEKTTFDVILEEIPADKKVAVYKAVRGIANIAVNQVKDFTATLPKVLKEGATKEEAEEARKQLADAGAKCKVA